MYCSGVITTKTSFEGEVRAAVTVTQQTKMKITSIRSGSHGGGVTYSMTGIVYKSETLSDKGSCCKKIFYLLLKGNYSVQQPKITQHIILILLLLYYYYC